MAEKHTWGQFSSKVPVEGRLNKTVVDHWSKAKSCFYIRDDSQNTH